MSVLPLDFAVPGAWGRPLPGSGAGGSAKGTVSRFEALLRQLRDEEHDAAMAHRGVIAGRPAERSRWPTPMMMNPLHPPMADGIIPLAAPTAMIKIKGSIQNPHRDELRPTRRGIG